MSTRSIAILPRWSICAAASSRAFANRSLSRAEVRASARACDTRRYRDRRSRGPLAPSRRAHSRRSARRGPCVVASSSGVASQLLPSSANTRWLRDVVDVLARGHQIEVAGLGPVVLRPAREAERERQVAEVDDPERRQTGAQQEHAHALGARQQPLEDVEPAAAPHADFAGVAVGLAGARTLDDVVPRLDRRSRRARRASA